MNELDELRDILLERDRRELAAVRERVDDPSIRAREMAEVLPRALRISAAAADTHLTSALQRPVAHCIRQSIQNDTQAFADALFPVMGPAIRRAISEALQGLVESINAAVESSLTGRGLRWRWEAWRTGSSYGSVVLKHTLRYRVEQALLIHRPSGLLIRHVGVDDLPPTDNDAVAGMLLAVQDFVRDSFAPESDESLETLELGDHFVWVMEGPYALLACVIRNAPPADLRAQLAGVLEDIHAGYATALQEYRGDGATLEGVDVDLQRALRSERQEGTPVLKRSRKWPLVVASLAIAAALVWWGWQRSQAAHYLASVEAGLKGIPGFVPLAVVAGSAGVEVEGLLDPLARDPREWLRERGVDSAGMTLRSRPYHSLEPPLVLARARARLRPPDSVRAELDEDGGLRFSGVASAEWIRQAKAVWMLPDGVRSLDFGALEMDRRSLLQALMGHLDPPPGARVTLDGQRVRVAGRAPWAWLEALPGRLAAVDWVRGLDYGELSIPQWDRARARAEALRTIRFFFLEAAALRNDAYVEIERAVEEIRDLRSLSTAMRIPLRLTVVASSDGVGDRERNLDVRRQRARMLAELLQRRLGDPLAEATAVDPDFKASETPDLDLRRAWIRVELPHPPTPPEYTP